MVIAPKTHIDYGRCSVPVIGRTDMDIYNAMNVYWGQGRIRIVAEGEDALLKRLSFVRIPYFK